MEWQPIETAPKDGSFIVTATWVDDEWRVEVDKWEPGPHPFWGVMSTKAEGLIYPTHWMPLPEPPTA